MATWRYVVSVTRDGDDDLWEMREYYHDVSGSELWTANSVGPSGSSLDELRSDLQRMMDALDHEILDLTREEHSLRGIDGE